MASQVILIPGIKGTELANTYPISYEITWNVPNMFLVDVYDLALNETGLVDMKPEVVTRSWQVFNIIYKQMYNYLRNYLNTQVYVFGYDWRLSSAENGKRLCQFIEQLNLKSPGAKNKYHFVVHSMGGLVLRSAMKSWSDGKFPSDRIVFIATPHQGSLDAIDAMVRGESMLMQSAKDMRKISRTMPSVYELLPGSGIQNAVVNEAGQAMDIYSVDSWQTNVTSADAAPYIVTQRKLANAQAFHNEGMADTGTLDPKNTLVIYGSESNSTMSLITAKKDPRIGYMYDFTNALKGEGDGVVLRNSAAIPGIPAVKITKGDIRWYEVLDQALVRAIGLHGILPVVNEVFTITGRFFKGEADLLPLHFEGERLEQ